MPSSRLPRILGLWFALAVTVGNTVGAGILRTPGSIAALFIDSPHWFVGIWLVGALYATLGANALAELGTMQPHSGGQFVFARRAFGDYAGFVVGWMDWLSISASAAAIAVVFGESFAALLGKPQATAWIGIGIIALFTALLVGGTSLGDRAQRLTSLLKALVLLVLVAACFVGTPRTVAPVEPHVPRPITLSAFLLAVQAVIYTYDGWTGPIYFSEELENADRAIPRSMFVSLACVAAIYLLVNIAFAHVAPLGALAGSELAAGQVARMLFGSTGDWLVRAVVIIGLPSAVNACILIASRVLFAVSRDGLGPRAASRVTRTGVPALALVASGAVAAAFVATGTFEQIIAIAVFFFVATYSLSFLGVFVLRRREPGARRPYRAIGHPWTTAFVLAGSVGFLIAAVLADRRNSLVALGVLVASYPVFRVARRPAVPAGSADPYVSEP